MGYINIFVSSEVQLTIKNQQLTISKQGDSISYPFEDINSLMIENNQSVISTYTLSKLAEHGIITFMCDSTHLPCGIVLPYCQHYQTALMFEYQNNLSKPLQKNLWRTLVKNKIENQNDVLNICGGADELKDIYNKVLSGDSTNCEAQASLLYFKELYGKGFKRREDNNINACLNYGYAILRGFVARSVCVHGLMPFMGINHKNQFNQFNLVDDLLEVFRPLVDLYTKMELENVKELTTQIKGKIYNIVNLEVDVNGEKHSVSYAIDLLVQSYVKSIKENKDLLKNIKIIGLNNHNYE